MNEHKLHETKFSYIFLAKTPITHSTCYRGNHNFTILVHTPAFFKSIENLKIISYEEKTMFETKKVDR